MMHNNIQLIYPMCMITITIITFYYNKNNYQISSLCRTNVVDIIVGLTYITRQHLFITCPLT